MKRRLENISYKNRTLKKNFDGRKIVICREMSKFYEEFIRTNVDQL